MSQTFWAQSKEGNLSLGSGYNRARFKKFLVENPGVRIKLDPYTPESRKQRNFFEGGVVALITYYQNGFDYRESNDCKIIRGWLKTEFNGEFRVIGGKSIKVPKSTKGELNKGFLERVMDWGYEQGYQMDLLVPEDYKKWRDEIFPYGGPDCYIDYLLEIGKLKKRS